MEWEITYIIMLEFMQSMCDSLIASMMIFYFVDRIGHEFMQKIGNKSTHLWFGVPFSEESSIFNTNLPKNTQKIQFENLLLKRHYSIFQLYQQNYSLFFLGCFLFSTSINLILKNILKVFFSYPFYTKNSINKSLLYQRYFDVTAFINIFKFANSSL